MLENIYSYFCSLYDKRPILFCSVVSLFVLALDYATGRNVQFPIFFVLPVGLLAFSGHRIVAYSMSVILPMIRVGFNLIWNENDLFHFTLTNAAINIAALFIYAYFANLIFIQTNLLAKKVKILEGILQQCPTCKRIRNENGEYEQAEKYISDHSEAEFSHGLCPDCANEFYPKYFKDKINFIAKQTPSNEEELRVE